MVMVMVVGIVAVIAIVNGRRYHLLPLPGKLSMVMFSLQMLLSDPSTYRRAVARGAKKERNDL